MKKYVYVMRYDTCTIEEIELAVNLPIPDQDFDLYIDDYLSEMYNLDEIHYMISDEPIEMVGKSDAMSTAAQLKGGNPVKIDENEFMDPYNEIYDLSVYNIKRYAETKGGKAVQLPFEMYVINKSIIKGLKEFDPKFSIDASMESLAYQTDFLYELFRSTIHKDLVPPVACEFEEKSVAKGSVDGTMTVLKSLKCEFSPTEKYEYLIISNGVNREIISQFILCQTRTSAERLMDLIAEGV